MLHPGSAEFDAAKKTYTVKGSGENMWFGTDAFEFVWKRVSGDVDLTASIQFPEKGGNAHRKGVLMVRQSLDADSPYADVALHGDGLTSLQFREEKGGNTHEVQANLTAPKRLRLAKRGDSVFMWLAGDGPDLKLAAGSPPVVLKAPFYVGIGVCSHEKDVVETAVFSGVEIATPQPREPAFYSVLETVPVASTDRRAIYAAQGRIESPAWTADGQALTFLRDGKAEQVGLAGGAPQPAAAEARGAVSGSGASEELKAAAAADCYPAFSPDGQSVAFLHFDGVSGCPADKEATLRVIALADRKTRVIARGVLGPAAWSPDGKRLTYVSYHQVN